MFAGNDGTLTVHGPFTGQRTLSLPRRASVYDVFDDKIIAVNTRSFRAFVRARATRLFLWGDGPALAAATGLELPAQSAEAEAAPEARTEARTEARQEPPRVSAPPPLTPRRAASEISALPVLIPGLESSDDTLDTLDDNEPDENEPTGETAADGSDTSEPSRRSRWQRRRAALRTRKEAERLARLSEASLDQSNAANPPVDMETLLPGLPPRRAPAAGPSLTAPDAPDFADDSDFADELDYAEAPAPPSIAAERVAGIVASDMADDMEQEESEE